MADGTHIEWTDATWQPITGCSVVSPGCTNCYAMRLAGTRLRHHPSRAGLTIDANAGPVWNGEVRFNEDWLDQPIRWRRPRRVFVCAHGDLFHRGIPDEWIDKVFAVMALSPRHTFQVLTKRPEHMLDYVNDPQRGAKVWWQAHKIGGICEPWPLRNVWLGVSVEDQERADERIPLLLKTPAAKRFISAEPLLGPIDLTPKGDLTYQRLSEWYGPEGFDPTGSQPRRERQSGWFPRLDWVIVGGESGPGARPMEMRWAHDIVSQCQAAKVAVFVKQLGSRPVVGGQTYTHPYARTPVDQKPKGKGGDMGEWPESIRVREFPA